MSVGELMPRKFIQILKQLLDVWHGESARPNSSKARAPSRKQVTSALPGPSTVVADKPSSKRVETMHEISEDDDVVALDEPPNVNPTKPPSKPAVSSNIIKGKDKVSRKHKSRKPATLVGESEAVVEHPMDTDASGVPPTRPHSNPVAGMSKALISTDTTHRKELERWKQRVKDVGPNSSIQFSAHLHIGSLSPKEMRYQHS